MESRRTRFWFAGLGRLLNDHLLDGQPQLPTLRDFALGLIAILVVAWGMVQVRAGVWLDAVILVGSGLALWLWRYSKSATVPPSVIGATRLALPRLWLGGALAAAAIGMAIWAWFSLSIAFTSDADWFRYLGSIALLIIAAVVMEPWQGRKWRVRPLTATGWCLLCIILLAAVVRLLALNSLPFGTWYDEAANGLEALRVAHEPAYRPIYTDGVNSTGHYLWLIVGAFKLVGENTVAVRSISAVMGVASCVAAYFVGRELHNPTVGLVFAALMAFARWSITFSRLGMYNHATPLFELLAFFWLLRGLRRGSALDFTLAGVAIGLGLCFYAAFQLFLGVLGIFVLVVAWRERARWRTLLGGLVITALAVAIVIAPVVHFALDRPESYFARVQATSLFADKRPEQRLPALWENTRKHLLMFNVRGDPNGRHNLPGEPMLDWMSGGLLVVGLVTHLRRSFEPRYMIVPVWILVGLLGGIFSLDFEAPQSLRAIGALPAVILCAAVPAAEVARTWARGAGRYFPTGGLWIVGLALLLPAGSANLHTYFVRQARDFAAWNAHSTPETLTAHLLRDANPTVEKYVISLYDGHPTVRFLAREVSYQRVETNMTLPILREMPQGMLMILDGERRALYEEARRLYPNSAFQEITSPYGGPVVVFVNSLMSEDLQSVQGLVGEYVNADAPAAPVQLKELTIDVEWPESAPVPLPFAATWQGVLAVNTYGPHLFFVDAPGFAKLQIGSTVLLEGDASEGLGLGGALLLARGHHAIRLEAEGGEGRVRLAWQPPDGPPVTVPSWALYVPPVQSNGLLGHYFPNGEWAGEPAFAQIDPRISTYFHVPVLPRPYTVEWRGKLAVPTQGDYDFGLQSIDESSLSIDGVEVVVNLTRNELAVGGVTLEAGLHDIVLRYADRTDHTYINLSWRVPNGDGALRQIPSELLFPPQADYARVDVGDLARFVEQPGQGPTVTAQLPTSPAQVEVVASGLAQPRGVAVAGNVVYVAETGNGRVLAFDRLSGEAVTSPFAESALVEPFDIATSPDGAVIVLDASTGQLWRYDPAREVVEVVAVSPDFVLRSRGLAVGEQGEIWIANTPAQRIVVVEADGNVRQEIALPAISSGQTDMQPVDVVAMGDNTLFVTDVAGHTLYRFSQAGYLLGSQPIPVANSLDSAHLDTDAAGQLFMTEPEAGRVVKMDGAGNVVQVWSVRTPETENAKPVGIAVAEDGAVWVADSQGGRLLRLVPEAVE